MGNSLLMGAGNPVKFASGVITGGSASLTRVQGMKANPGGGYDCYYVIARLGSKPDVFILYEDGYLVNYNQCRKLFVITTDGFLTNSLCGGDEHRTVLGASLTEDPKYFYMDDLGCTAAGEVRLHSSPYNWNPGGSYATAGLTYYGNPNPIYWKAVWIKK